MENIKAEQATLLSQNKELTSEVEELRGKFEVVSQEKCGAVQRVKELEEKMLDIEKENSELKRRIELISSLRNSTPREQQIKHESENESKKSSFSQRGSSSAVDSAWSQAQAFGSDASSQSHRL